MQSAALETVNQPVTELTLIPGVLHIGRNKDNDIVLTEPGVSDYHAKIITYFHQSILVDLSSEAGCYLNGKHVIKHTIKSGDMVKLGEHCFKIRLRSF